MSGIFSSGWKVIFPSKTPCEVILRNLTEEIGLSVSDIIRRLKPGVDIVITYSNDSVVTQ